MSLDPSIPSTTVRAGVLGASGSTGTELLCWLDAHPAVEIAFATSGSHAGETARHVDPACPDVPFVPPAEADPTGVDVLFACMPHGQAEAWSHLATDDGPRIIDLSGDFRLVDAARHAAAYGSPRDQALADRAVYGLTEHVRARLPEARLVANPGCYPTCSLLPLVPLAEAGLLGRGATIVAQSGVSGAGRRPSPLTHFCAVTDDVRPYALGRAHRHVPEMEQWLAARGGAGPIVFCPQVVPIERGMLATIVLDAPGETAEAVHARLAGAYADEPFVEVLPLGAAARVRGVARTNLAQIGVHPVDGADRVVLTSAIDNLGKGAAGQAVQNMNAMLGLPETTGMGRVRGGRTATPPETASG